MINYSVRLIANNRLEMIGSIRETSKTDWTFSMNFISFLQVIDVSGEKLFFEGKKVMDVRTLFNKRYLFGNWEYVCIHMYALRVEELAKNQLIHVVDS